MSQIEGHSPGFDLERRRAQHTHALVVGPYLVVRPQAGAASLVPGRAPQARLEEAAGLARAIDLDLAETCLVPLAKITPATYMGKGKTEEIAARVKADTIDLVVMDCALSPGQQRNLEKAFGAKVIDRTGLILEIFGRRARTREGSLQVEHAHLHYQKSRLVRSWTHLERQRGGFGFLGGPGETQIETDRRLIQERISRIERDLEGVKKTRGLHRKTRQDAPYPVVAIVGYTNAGKSTLFNRLTHADVLAKDMLFATLDPTLRGVRLPHGAKIMLSDTVGFISDLPTTLVSAFRATLEEVIEADVILHVRDLSHEDTAEQSVDVKQILADLGVDPEDDRRILEVWNKIDLLDPEQRARQLGIAKLKRGRGRIHAVSALTGEGLAALLAGVEERLSSGHAQYRVSVPPGDGQGLAWLHEHCEVLERSSNDDGATNVLVRVSPERVERLQRRFAGAEQTRAQVRARPTVKKKV